MGFLDVLKKLVPKSEPLDPHTLRHELFTLRLPEGWRFTADHGRSATAMGPANQAVTFYFNWGAEGIPTTAQEIERRRPEMLKLLGTLVKADARFKATPVQNVLANGVLWIEASEVQGADQQFVVYTANPQPERPQRPAMLIQISLRTSVPVSSGALGAERLETLRGVLRKVEWN
jgi:hypothetical protein